MIQDRELERVMRDWLDDGPMRLDDRVVRTTMTSIRAAHVTRRSWAQPSPAALVWLAAVLVLATATAIAVGSVLRAWPALLP